MRHFILRFCRGTATITDVFASRCVGVTAAWCDAEVKADELCKALGSGWTVESVNSATHREYTEAVNEKYFVMLLVDQDCRVCQV